MFPTLEGFVFAIQDEAISNCCCLKYIIQDPKVVTKTYHYCGSSSETIQPVIVSCPKLAHIKQKPRHKPAAKFYIRNWRSSFFFFLKKKYSPYYRHEPQFVLENNGCTLCWDCATTLVDRTNKEAAFLDVATPLTL